jgi:peptidoglycan/xylan/chitin deacetylase (PgdA/CDA1 family)
MLIERMNRWQKAYSSHVLLYHATFAEVPDDLLRSNLHNVQPDALFKQVEWLKRHFDVVSLDDLFLRPSNGQAAITFDDAFECVFLEAQPVLESLRVPFTVFVNGISLREQPTIPDMVRFLTNRSLVEDFLAFFRRTLSDVNCSMNVDSFHESCKDPSTNGPALEKALGQFLEGIGVPQASVSYCVKSPQIARVSEYLTLGNHSLRHYVLSSLTEAEQEEEIVENEKILTRLGHRISRVFSLPYGGPQHFNLTTLRLLKRHAYAGFVYSRRRLNFLPRKSLCVDGDVIPSAERYMVASTFEGFQRQIFRLFAKNVKGRLLGAGDIGV